ncbi:MULTISPECIES: endoribonuclease MazF [Enterobacterales]|uniref:endoribonuclease MazF n=1 Tax=Enterobacterales TaxID=91347 RepID=UPI0003BE02E7|nr:MULTISPECIES: endoribonuclease MazF [Enterobacteriaceae]EDF6232775.1 endoribonuclease MazF [Salmonella enterica subsp. enterica serovar Senftenberg]EIY9028126.1 endoribonuclease MazF [Salmonella enterica]EKY3945784.1 endoribonuclease MazF [Enterobacter hormaechei]MDE1513150.1 endoribonuclease MazF [Serratia nevei]HBR1132773.1 endoribonuclease MazF [Klebsiella quasipneumoniae subsp. similipneumoniae]HCL6052309.1 endoribonuclease MazF [Raoultella ornithinolytica]HCM5085226.1 endoribonucleas
MVKRYVPDAGDLIWIDFDPVAGHEQGGHRPAVVLSPFAYNNKVGLLLCVPCTTQVKGYPFEVTLSGSKEGVALSDQITCVDWRARKVTQKSTVSKSELAEIRAKAKALIG